MTESKNDITSLTLSKSRRWASLIVLSLGLFVVSIDMTVLNIALPFLTMDLKPTSDQQLWIIDVYSLVLAGLLVPASSLSDRLGRKKMLLAGFAVFGLGSLLVVFATSASLVIAVRALLGLGGAMIMPTTLSLIRSVFSNPKERAIALAVWSAIAGLGMAVGPIIGGGLLELFSWHAAFLINAPLMALSFIAGLFILPEVKIPNPGRWDVVAALVALVGLTLLMWAIKHIAALMAFDIAGALALLVGIVLMVYFVVRCKNSSSPLLDVTLFKSKTFTAGIVAALGAMFAMAALLFLLAQWLQLIEGSGPLESGIKLIPIAAGSIIASAAAPYLAEKFRLRRVIVGGLIVAGIGMVMLLPFSGNLSYPPVAIAGFLVGAGAGVLALGSVLIMLETPVEKAASAAAFEEISYDLGNVLGVAVLGSVASIIYRMGLDIEELSSLGLGQESIDGALDSFSAAYAIAEETGVTELLREGSASFTESIIITSAIGGIVIFVVAFVVRKLIPKDLTIEG